MIGLESTSLIWIDTINLRAELKYLNWQTNVTNLVLIIRWRYRKWRKHLFFLLFEVLLSPVSVNNELKTFW